MLRDKNNVLFHYFEPTVQAVYKSPEERAKIEEIIRVATDQALKDLQLRSDEYLNWFFSPSPKRDRRISKPKMFQLAREGRRYQTDHIIGAVWLSTYEGLVTSEFPYLLSYSLRCGAVISSGMTPPTPLFGSIIRDGLRHHTYDNVMSMSPPRNIVTTEVIPLLDESERRLEAMVADLKEEG